MRSPYLTTAEAADYLRYQSPSAVRTLKMKGLLRPAGRRGGTDLYRVDDLDHFVSSRASGSRAQGPRTPPLPETRGNDRASWRDDLSSVGRNISRQRADSKTSGRGTFAARILRAGGERNLGRGDIVPDASLTAFHRGAGSNTRWPSDRREKVERASRARTQGDRATIAGSARVGLRARLCLVGHRLLLSRHGRRPNRSRRRRGRFRSATGSRFT